MERTVKAHIETLEAKLSQLTSEQMATADKDRRNSLETDLRAVRLALAHYRAALEIEKELGTKS